MKKAMFGLACAAAMVACADITSSNIVGYTNKDAGADFSLVVPMFKECAGSEFDIQKLVPQGENALGDGNINLQTFTTDANADEMFYYLTTEGAGAEQDGWYEEDLTTFATKKFAPGEGFMFCGGNGAVKLMFSGEVDLSDVVVDVPADFSLLGNIRPMDCSIQSVIPQGENAVGDGNINIQTFTSDANADEMFYYLTTEDAGAEKNGWYEEDLTTFATKTFVPGEGFMFCGGNGACQLKFATAAK